MSLTPELFQQVIDDDLIVGSETVPPGLPSTSGADDLLPALNVRWNTSTGQIASLWAWNPDPAGDGSLPGVWAMLTNAAPDTNSHPLEAGWKGLHTSWHRSSEFEPVGKTGTATVIAMVAQRRPAGALIPFILEAVTGAAAPTMVLDGAYDPTPGAGPEIVPVTPAMVGAAVGNRISTRTFTVADATTGYACRPDDAITVRSNGDWLWVDGPDGQGFALLIVVA